MKKRIIAEYIKGITKEHIRKFAYENGIVFNEYEIDIAYQEIKSNWEYYLYGNPNFLCFEKFGDKEKIVKLFSLYKEKYKNYL